MKYRDEDWLYNAYVTERRNVTDIADECGVSPSALYRWLDKFDIPRREDQTGGKYRDEDWLREQYIDERRSTSEIGTECDVHKETINRWLDRHGIEKRSRSERIAVQWEDNEERRREQAEWFREKMYVNRCSYFMNDEGYMVVSDSFDQVRLHRLIAVAEHGVEEVKDKHVHHDIPIPWLNYPGNLIPVTAEEHRELHI